ncbi:MAG TPA: FAD-dependent oxidoreductase, partial [Enhygromyxa sp.]|nr:FAD-dependent oxidoreductase [Enhygromyxa sp.]
TSGMGDVVFAPLYEALRRRGVRFEFFHRLTNVAVRDDRFGAHVTALEFDVQAATVDGREYEPLVHVRDLPCWPALPRYEQLLDGERHRAAGRTFEAVDDHERTAAKTLRVQRDFDFVVLGLGLGSIPSVCAEILARDPRWREMVARCKTVATQAAQLWMREDMTALGWSGSPTNLSGYVRPFATWADMRQLIREESLDPAPRALAYLCCVLPERERSDAAQAHQEVRANAIRFLERDVHVLWPGAIERGQFRWSLLCDDRDGTAAAVDGERRIDSQYWIANVEGSARYSQSVPGSIAYRISPLDRTYDNLTVAGDWTATGLDSGCVESAVMSGLLAAHAIAGSPALEEIIGYDHP